MRIPALLAASALIIGGPRAVAAPPDPNNLSCTVGPLTKTFGGTQWLVYGCDDGHSVVVITAPNNPAMPFYFFFLRGPNGTELHGEGTGDKKVTDAAFADLKELTDADVAELFRQAQAASHRQGH
jgi:hypothetical protein